MDILLAPTLCFGASDHHLPFGGTLSLSTDTLRAVLTDLVRSAAEAGCRRILLLNGHGGNASTCLVVASDLARQTGALVAAASYWDLVDPPEGLSGRFPGHAGEFETSLMLVVRPELVRLDRARPSPGSYQPLPRVFMRARPTSGRGSTVFRMIHGRRTRRSARQFRPPGRSARRRDRGARRRVTAASAQAGGELPTLFSLVGGRVREGIETVPDENPSDPSTHVAFSSFAGPKLAAEAVENASEAFPLWGATPPPARGEILRRAADLLSERLETIARDLSLEEGKRCPKPGAR